MSRKPYKSPIYEVSVFFPILSTFNKQKIFFAHFTYIPTLHLIIVLFLIHQPIDIFLLAYHPNHITVFEQHMGFGTQQVSVFFLHTDH